ncbi:hypothetical protein KUTeg_006141 [Tegillarca granosa]|uniref:SH3 domain-containing protein n=1 Tax=Tegillarca granosa TaxID=220873 RepID=A0ABQ9FHX1_TEGGR|nr:hypothetical protein KUTeg_006141 [Tegillarca granosa]
MFDVQNIYGTPQIPRKRPCLQPRRMTLIDLRNVRVDEEDEPYRKSSTATIRSEGTGTQYYSSKHGGVLQVYDSSDNSSLDSKRSSCSNMRIRRVSSNFDANSRFPKLEECAHFHYDSVELTAIKVNLCDEDQENTKRDVEDINERTFLVKVCSNDKTWKVRRTFKNFRSLDRQLHKCIYDRKFSRLTDLETEANRIQSYEVGDIVSVIDMPPVEDTIWWRGKRGFEVGFFPSECVEVIGDKVPPSMESRIPSSSSASRKQKPCKAGICLVFVLLYQLSFLSKIDKVLKKKIFLTLGFVEIYKIKKANKNSLMEVIGKLTDFFPHNFFMDNILKLLLCQIKTHLLLVHMFLGSKYIHP